MAGLFQMPSPEMVRQSARQGLFKQAQQVAAAPAGRGFVQAAAQAGGLFGEALGRGMGGTTPGEIEAQKFQQVQQQIQDQYKDADLADPNVQIQMMGDSAKLLMDAGFGDAATQALQMAANIRNSIPRTKPADVWAKLDPEKFTPESIRKFERTGLRSDLRAKLAPRSENLSVGERAVDKAFAKTFVGWTTGDSADVEKNIKQLEEAKTRLERGEENLTGPILGNTPDIVRQQTHPESLDVRDQVEEVVQRNLRLILGAQFTQKEGERLIARAYNEKLDEETNAKRLGRLITAIKKAAEAKQEAVDYFNKNQTLSGFKGKTFSLADIEAELEKELESPVSGAGLPQGWSVRKK